MLLTGADSISRTNHDGHEGPITVVDLFCGAVGLSYGLQKAGLSVVAGVDLDPACACPFESDIDAAFFERDVQDLTADDLRALWGDCEIRALVGCAPSRPFSPYRRGADTSSEKDWPLSSESVGSFARSGPSD